MAAPKSGPKAKNPNSKNQLKLAQRTRENMTPEMLKRRDIFVDYIIKGYPKYQAAMIAGVPPRSAHKQGSEMFCEPYVQEQYKKLRDAIEEDQIVDRKDVVIGLVTEARREGFGSSHAGRVSAWTQVSKVMGFEAPTKGSLDVNIKGGVMMVPVVGSVSEWEKTAQSAQDQLKQDVRT